jgi:putative ABC transport system permease protein
MASMLRRKLIRDLAHHRGQAIAIGLMMALGIALFISLRGMNGYLRDSQARYYAQYRFADVFASVHRAPRALLPRLRAIPGVASVEPRIVAEVVVDLPGSREPVTARLVSIPDHPRSMLNGVHLVRGPYPDPSGPDAIVSQAFARANRLGIGDTLGAIVNGRRERLRVGAIGQSPEFVYEIRSGGADFLPDSRRYGVIWIPERRLAAGFDLVGSFNDLAMELERGARANDVITATDNLLAEYGGLGAYLRADQISHRFVTDEITETKVTAVLLPSIFLGVTAFMLWLVTSRLVATEREQVALLKAFGFSTAAVARHYVGFILVPAVGGAVVGSGLGVWFARYFSGVYDRFFQFPVGSFHLDPAIFLIGLAIALLAAALGGFAAVRATVRLPPAEAMRPPSPPRFQAGLLERLGISRRFSAPLRIIFRNIERRPTQTVLTIAGLSLALAIVIAGWYVFDAIDLLKTIQFYEAERAEIRVGFGSQRGGAVRYELARLPGVRQVELTRAVPVRIQFGSRTVRTALQGIAREGTLRRLVEPPNRVVALPEVGLLMSRSLANKLHVGRGEVVTIESLVGRRQTFALPVAGVVDEVIGMSGYLDLALMHRLWAESDVADGALLSVDVSERRALEQRLKQFPAVSGVSNRDAVVAAFDRTIAESFQISLVVIFGAACLIAAAIVYNSGRIALSERARELASLRVLGFSRGEVTAMLLGEQGLLLLLSMPAGFALGYFLCYLMTARLALELFRLPMIVNPSTYLMAGGVVAGSGLLTGLLIRERIRHFDLVAVLKARE